MRGITVHLIGRSHLTIFEFKVERAIGCLAIDPNRNAYTDYRTNGIDCKRFYFYKGVFVYWLLVIRNRDK